jgi:hypothetical protein
VYANARASIQSDYASAVRKSFTSSFTKATTVETADREYGVFYKGGSSAPPPPTAPHLSNMTLAPSHSHAALTAAAAAAAALATARANAATAAATAASASAGAWVAPPAPGVHPSRLAQISAAAPTATATPVTTAIPLSVQASTHTAAPSPSSYFAGAGAYVATAADGSSLHASGHYDGVSASAVAGGLIHAAHQAQQPTAPGGVKRKSRWDT